MQRPLAFAIDSQCIFHYYVKERFSNLGLMKKLYNVYFDPDIDAVVMEWSGYAKREEFRAGTELMLEILKDSKATKVVGNITDFVLIGMEDQNWLLYNFLPRAVEFGFRHCALTVPKFYFNKVAVENVITSLADKNLEVRLFENFIEATNWISKA